MSITETLQIFMRISKSFIFFALVLLNSCNEAVNSYHQSSSDETKILNEDKPKVKVIDLKPGKFYKEIISNGKLYALHKADLKFRVTEIIEEIRVKNGDLVEKNSVIAKLNNYTYQTRLQRSRLAFEKAKLDFQDALLGYGIQHTDSTRIPPAIWKMCRIRSGYDNTLVDLQTAEYEFQNTILKAPFRGTICNLNSKENNLPSNEAFCMLVDNSSFEAVFQLLESELGNISVNQPVVVIPFALDSTAQSGIVSEINPIVDENGLITVKARINNSRKVLFEGMNVRVIVRKVYPDNLIVPKSAVVLRSGKEVVFTLEGNLAKWNYVKTGEENTTSFSIVDGLKPGMKVIISGNLNLGHDAEVEVINKL